KGNPAFPFFLPFACHIFPGLAVGLLGEGHGPRDARIRRNPAPAPADPHWQPSSLRSALGEAPAIPAPTRRAAPGPETAPPSRPTGRRARGPDGGGPPVGRVFGASADALPLVATPAGERPAPHDTPPPRQGRPPGHRPRGGTARSVFAGARPAVPCSRL